MSYPRELDECIFCGDSDMTEEHLIAAWVLRAGEPISTAKVVCRSCNNEWLSVIDNAAADVLKPLIRGDETVTLDGEGQAVFAAWIYKCALIFDAAANDNDGDLVPLARGISDLAASRAGSDISSSPTWRERSAARSGSLASLHPLRRTMSSARRPPVRLDH